MNNIAELHESIAAICPIHGVNSNREIAFKDEATPEKREAAQKVADEWVFA